jgi:hypothetical protein
MAAKKDQHKVGIPAKPRGQQMGFAGNPDQNREAEKETPATRGRRKVGNKMFADDSSQDIGTSPVTPKTNQPSTPAFSQRARGESGGERSFKRRLAKSRAAKN